MTRDHVERASGKLKLNGRKLGGLPRPFTVDSPGYTPYCSVTLCTRNTKGVIQAQTNLSIASNWVLAGTVKGQRRGALTYRLMQRRAVSRVTPMTIILYVHAGIFYARYKTYIGQVERSKTNRGQKASTRGFSSTRRREKPQVCILAQQPRNVKQLQLSPVMAQN